MISILSRMMLNYVRQHKTIKTRNSSRPKLSIHPRRVKELLVVQLLTYRLPLECQPTSEEMATAKVLTTVPLHQLPLLPNLMSQANAAPPTSTKVSNKPLPIQSNPPTSSSSNFPPNSKPKQSLQSRRNFNTTLLGSWVRWV